MLRINHDHNGRQDRRGHSTSPPDPSTSPEAAPTFSRRGLLLSGGLAATSALLLPGQAAAQFDIGPIDLPFGDQKRAADAVSFFQRWYTLFDLTETYGQLHGKAREVDRPALRATSGYLIGTLKARGDDMLWIAGVRQKQADAFQARAHESIQQSRLANDNARELNESLIVGARDNELADRLPPTLGGVEELLRRSTDETGIPRVVNDELRHDWLCMLLHSMLTSALAASRWYMVAPLASQLRFAGCLK